MFYIILFFNIIIFIDYRLFIYFRFGLYSFIVTLRFISNYLIILSSYRSTTVLKLLLYFSLLFYYERAYS